MATPIEINKSRKAMTMANLMKARSKPKTMMSFLSKANASRTAADTTVPRPSAINNPIIIRREYQRAPFSFSQSNKPLFQSRRTKLAADTRREVAGIKPSGLYRPRSHHRRRRRGRVEPTQLFAAPATLQIVVQHISAQNYQRHR